MAQMNYSTVGSNDLERAKSFYDELLGSVGMSKMFEHPSGGRLYGHNGAVNFGVLGPFDGKPATVGNGSMSGFSFDSQEEAKAFYDKAIALGATCEGPPGERMPGVYFAYFRDLDGNKLAAYKFG